MARLRGELSKANKWNVDHYEETIKLRRRWQWERRRADRLRDECGQWLVDYMKQNSDFYKEREYAQTLLAERDALRARCERLRVVLRELARAATDTANEHGCSGDLGARLSEARAAPKEDSDGK